MAGEIFGFTLNDVDRLRRMLQEYETGAYRNVPRNRERDIRTAGAVELGKADSTIAGTTTGTPGSGTVSIYRFTSTGGTSDTGLNITAYNFSKDTVASGRWLHLVRHHRSGRWLVNYEDCGTTS